MSFRNDPAERERALVEAVSRFLESSTPEGPILVVGDPSPAAAGLFAGAGLEVDRWHRSMVAETANALPAERAAGKTGTASGETAPGDSERPVVSPWPPEGLWQTVAVRLPRSKGEMEMLVHAAASRIAPSGELLVYGANDEGIKSADAVIDPLFGWVETATVKSRCRVLRARRPDGAWPSELRSTLADWRTVTELEIGGRVRPWVSYPGVFSHGRVDPGTRLLLESLGSFDGGATSASEKALVPGAALSSRAALSSGVSILDYGCGSGVLAAGLLGTLAVNRPQPNLHLIDPDTVALEAARENLPAARIHVGTSLETMGDLRLDLIAANPPYHRGKAEDLGVVESLIRDAPTHLVPGGSLVMVVQRRLPVEGILRDAFGRVAILGEDGTYRVWEGKEPPPH